VKKRAVVLLSGGLDSAVTLYYARRQGYTCYCLSFAYGQRHRRELVSSRSVASASGSSLEVLKLNLPWKGSSLLDDRLALPDRTKLSRSARPAIPNTYVPGRNAIFLSYALSYAEAIGAEAVFIGAHAQDYSGYPDCRPQFYRILNRLAAVGTKAGVEKKLLRVMTPLIHKDKAGIIRLGVRLGVPFELTWSCYRGGKSPCGRCESCFYRSKGFREAGLHDPLMRR